MDRARPGSGEAEADLAGEARMRAGYERGQFLVPRLQVIDLVAGPRDRADDVVNAFAGETMMRFTPIR